MSVLNKQITVSKEAYEKRWQNPMSQSLQDAFNDVLSSFSENEIDKTYDSPMNQFLKNDKGDIYYFDNFKYVYPKQVGDDTEVQVLNNSRGANQFCCVRYNRMSIVVENYNENGFVDIGSYFLTDQARAMIAGEHMNGNIGDFLLQVSANNQPYMELLHFGSRVIVKQENGNLVSYDINGNAIDSVPTNADTIQSTTPSGISFYSEVEKKVNYYHLLQKTYGLSEEQGSIGTGEMKR